MILKKTLFFSHKLGECAFRTITENDVSEDYIKGLKSEQIYIEHIPTNVNRVSQTHYISKIINSEQDTICGLFLNSELIGTAGIQNIQDGQKASIGVFLFNKATRGHGFGKILIWASCFLTNTEKNILFYFAGMKKENITSLKAFLSCGFNIESELADKYLVKNNIQNLKTPSIVNNIRLV